MSISDSENRSLTLLDLRFKRENSFSTLDNLRERSNTSRSLESRRQAATPTNVGRTLYPSLELLTTVVA